MQNCRGPIVGKRPARRTRAGLEGKKKLDALLGISSASRRVDDTSGIQRNIFRFTLLVYIAFSVISGVFCVSGDYGCTPIF